MGESVGVSLAVGLIIVASLGVYEENEVDHGFAGAFAENP